MPTLPSTALDGSQPAMFDEAVPTISEAVAGSAGGGPTLPSGPTSTLSQATVPAVAAADPSVAQFTPAESNRQLNDCVFSMVRAVFQPRHVACQRVASEVSRTRSRRMKCQPASTGSVVSISIGAEPAARLPYSIR